MLKVRNILQPKVVTSTLLLIFGLLLVLRFLFLDFGLPQVFQADEPELVEYSLKYAVNLDKLKSGDLMFYKPFSFVYGTLPTYANTIFLIPFLKFTSFFDLSQDRYFIYLYVRVIYAIFGIIACIGVYFLAHQITKKINLSLAAGILFSLVYSYLWLTRYVNNDTLIVLVSVWGTYFYLRYEEKGEKKNLLKAIFFLALGVAIKITFVIVLAYPVLKLLFNKKFSDLFQVILIVSIVYFVSNPFTLFFLSEFITRIMEMRIKENGIVLDSYNTNILKYFYSISAQTSIFVLFFSVYYLYQKMRAKKIDFAIFFALIFLFFFSLSSRLVDRWILPIIPILIIYALIQIYNFKNQIIKILIISLITLEFSYKFIQTNIELSEGASIVHAYHYIKEKYEESTDNVLVISERGLHPIKGGNFRRSRVFVQDFQFNQYESEGAFQSFPEEYPDYHVVVFSTKVRKYYSNPDARKINPKYYELWENFYQLLNNPKEYEKISIGSTDRYLTNQESIEIYTKINR